MLNRISVIFLLCILIVGGTAMGRDIPREIENMIAMGQYTKAREELKKMAEKEGVSEERRKELLFEAERLRRIPFDFRLMAEDVLEQIREDIPDATMEDVKKWTEDGTLESRLIDGKRLYFSRSVGNLYRLNKEAAAMREGEKDLKYFIKKALEAREESASPYVTPKRFHVKYTLSVKPGEVPEGEMIRCWLPFPKEVPTQKDIVLLSSSPEKHVIAPNKVEQRTVYMEQPSKGDEPTEFSITFEYTAYAFVQPVDPEKIGVYDAKCEEICQMYTVERPPQIVFTPEIKKVAAHIVGEETNPYLKAKKIFEWVQTNIPWTGAIEYSTVPNLAMRALTRKTGDCGMQGLLFINLCRVSGVPAKWQSGWTPRVGGGMGMHDWAQFYVEPYGWLYADASRGLIESDDEDVRWFNFVNFDPYRMIVNTNYGAELHPPKEHFRSEPVDFQRGEAEWKGGNLYFNQWDYDAECEEIELSE